MPNYKSPLACKFGKTSHATCLVSATTAAMQLPKKYGITAELSTHAVLTVLGSFLLLPGPPKDNVPSLKPSCFFVGEAP